MHNLINEEHGHDSVLANYIEQVKTKDRLLLERDGKLQELANKNGLLEADIVTLRQQLESGSIDARPSLGSQQSLRVKTVPDEATKKEL
jgi:hypothetical protein